jgi:predicted site-specific integrase-resolvase
MSLSETNLPPLAVSPRKAPKTLDVSEDTIERLVQAGKLKCVRISARRNGITWKSLRELVGE